MDHENVLKFIGICRQKDTIYLITELVLFGELAAAVAEDHIPRENWHIKIKMAYQGALSINYLHEKKIIHNDIKTGKYFFFSLKSNFFYSQLFFF